MLLITAHRNVPLHVEVNLVLPARHVPVLHQDSPLLLLVRMLLLLLWLLLGRRPSK